METISLCDNCKFTRSKCAVIDEELLYRDGKVVDCWLHIGYGLEEVVGYLQY